MRDNNGELLANLVRPKSRHNAGSSPRLRASTVAAAPCAGQPVRRAARLSRATCSAVVLHVLCDLSWHDRMHERLGCYNGYRDSYIGREAGTLSLSRFLTNTNTS